MIDYTTNEKGNLVLGGCDATELVEKYSTPLYVMEEEKIRNACRHYKNAFEKYYNGNGLACYASKALSCMEICRIIKDEGLGLDVVSDGELYTALKAGFPSDKIHFHGNNKTDTELSMALDANISCIVVDNICEMTRLSKIAEKKGCIANISLRIKPGIDAHTHDFIKTGQIDSKFGFALETGEALRAVETATKLKNLRLNELHCHIGSQIFDVEPFVTAAEVMMDLIAEIKEKYGIEIENLNLGGGIGIRYTDSDNPKLLDDYIKATSEAITRKAKQSNINRPYIYMEPGRSIVGEAGTTLYTVGCVKDIPNVRTYVSVDGGMTDNIRYALYGAEYKAVVANKANEQEKNVVTVAGKCCESGDLIQENIKLQNVKEGDIIAVFSTGAYNYSMASNYNRIRRPAMVMVKDGQSRVIVKRESFDDLIKNDV